MDLHLVKRPGIIHDRYLGCSPAVKGSNRVERYTTTFDQHIVGLVQRQKHTMAVVDGRADLLSEYPTACLFGCTQASLDWAPVAILHEPHQRDQGEGACTLSEGMQKETDSLGLDGEAIASKNRPTS